jgi:hypothetical protein
MFHIFPFTGNLHEIIACPVDQVGVQYVLQNKGLPVEKAGQG